MSITGDKAEIKGVGQVKFRSVLSDGTETNVTWREVYFVPTFTTNIVLTVATTKEGISQLIEGEVCRFLHNGVEVMRACLVGSKWIMNIKPHCSDEYKVNSVDKIESNKLIFLCEM